MMKYSFNSTTLRNMDLFEALAQIQASGYDGVELMLNESHLHPLRAAPARVAEIKDFCSALGLPIVCVSAGGDRLLSDLPYRPSLIEPDEKGRRERIELLKRSVEITRTLGAPVLNFNSGMLPDGLSPAAARDLLVQGIGELLAMKAELVLVMEPEPNFFIGSTADALALIEEIGDSTFRLNLDIGHVNCSEDDCYGAIERALPFTRHIHIEDIKQRVHDHEIPGEGDIDFRRVFSLLKGANYSYYVSVELHHHDGVWQRALGESLAYLRKIESEQA
jgi:sugar phosphate isomerase/epimerase